MDGRIVRKFEEWTSGLGPKEARISVFERVRDIPYAIIPEFRDPAHGPAGMLEADKGSCQPKHFLLAELFRKLGLQVEYATYPFRWARQPVRYPPELKKIVKDLPVSYHLACKAYIDSKWVLVDATWDPPLKKAGFPVNEKWDGSSDTMNAVRPLEEVLHKGAEERVLYETQQKSLHTEKEKASSAEFIDKLNRWLEDIRVS